MTYRKIQDLLIENAYREYGNRIRPCGGKKHLEECMEEINGAVFFYFMIDESTETMKAEL